MRERKRFSPGLPRIVSGNPQLAIITKGRRRLDISVKSVQHFTPTGTTQMLDLLQELPAVTFDLRDFCNLKEPGEYGVSLVGPPDQEGNRPESEEAWFTLVIPQKGK